MSARLMMRRVIAGIRHGLRLHYPGRNLEVFPDDIFIVSYPKSGNTWSRFLIANLVHPEEQATFGNINRFIPDPEALSVRQLSTMPRPRILKSHQYFDPRFQKVIYIVRDPRDVALSQYHFHRKRRLIADDSPAEEFVRRFVAGKTSPYASWAENVSSWLATRYFQPGFLLLRYEDMLADTISQLAKIALFLEREANDELLTQAAARSSADEMRNLEKIGAHLWSSTKSTRQDIPFVRTAKPGNWRTDLSKESIAEIESAWGPLIGWLGYPLVSGSNSHGSSNYLNEVIPAGYPR